MPVCLDVSIAVVCQGSVCCCVFPGQKCMPGGIVFHCLEVICRHCNDCASIVIQVKAEQLYIKTMIDTDRRGSTVMPLG